MKVINFTNPQEWRVWLLYAIAYRLQTAKKPETRERRIQAIIERLSRGEKFH
jgi:hypothetical protein